MAAFFFSVAIELIQYLTGLGIAELDDVFGNTLGGVIGVMMGVVVEMLEKRKNILRIDGANLCFTDKSIE